jgi:glycosyltransferase involved in cell wall biosynthesis
MRHCENAFVLDESNAIEIANAVRRIMADPELQKRLSEGAVAFFERTLSWEQSAKKLNAFYFASR